MKKSFVEYAKQRDDIALATALIESGIDVDAWVSYCTDLATNYKLSEGQMYQEFMAGLGNVAKQSFKNVFGDMYKAGRNMVQNLGNKVNVGMQGAKVAYAQGEIGDVVRRVGSLKNTLVKAGIPQANVDAFLQQVTQQLQAWNQQIAANAQTQQAVGRAQPQVAGSGI